LVWVCIRTHRLNPTPTGTPYGEANNAQQPERRSSATDIYYVAQGTGTNNRTNLVVVAEDQRRRPVDWIQVSRICAFGSASTRLHRQHRSANRYVTFDQVGADVIRALRWSVTANSVDVVSDTGSPLSAPSVRHQLQELGDRAMKNHEESPFHQPALLLVLTIIGVSAGRPRA
jgi:hypothetical protein